MELTRLGHAALLVQTSRCRLLVDPGTTGDAWHHVGGLDAVLVTHQHPDHCDVTNLAHLIELNPRARLLVEPEAAAMVAGHGFHAEAVPAGSRFEIGDVSVEAVGGAHAVIHPRIPAVGNVGFRITERSGPSLLHPGDSYEPPPSGVDVLALPLSAPWAKAGEAADFLGTVAPAHAFPIHDAFLSEQGRALFLRIVGGLADPSITLQHLAPDGTLTV